ncbi:MAG: peptidyl-prolyl cis-trans isomerase, partial [Dehalococcoidia bacterium]|nr:peptidyl-prolyl cis-trans isomerase [Dehalococcoidia bacterium]
ELELGVQGRDSEAVERLALRNLINLRLILQEAARRNFTVTEQELDQAFTALLRRFEDLGSFGVWMKERGLDDRSLFETMRGEILTERIKEALVEGLHVSEDQLQGYYEAHKSELKTEEVWLQMIVVKDEASAEEVQAALEKGEDFGSLAQQRSIGPRAAQGGDTGWVNSENLWPPLREAVRRLKPREAFGPLQSGEEFLIVRLHERRPGSMKTLAEARPEIEAGLLALNQQELLKAWLADQEKNSKIEVLP